MISRHRLAVLLAAGLPLSAHAADPCHVGIIAELPVTMTGLSPRVKVQINGRDAVFVADSGAWFSTISPGSAAEYALKLQPLPPWFRMSGVGGSVIPQLAVVKAFTIAGVTIPKVQFVVGGSEFGSVGLLGQNVLALADAEFDLAHSTIRLMRSRNCGGGSNLAYWVKPGDVYSVATTEPQPSERPHIVVPISVNGVRLRALLDTGAGTSFMATRAAGRIGLKPDRPGVRSAGMARGIGRHLVPTWIGPVASVKIGEEEIRNTRLRFGELEDVDMLLGADFFLSHRVYWSNALHKVFFTFNGGHVFDLRYLHEDEDGGDAPPPASSTRADGDTGELKSAEEFHRRATLRASKGDFTGALADEDRAISAAPDGVEYLRTHAELEARLKQPDKALKDLGALLKIKADDVDALIMRSELRRMTDQEADIRADVDAAARTAPKSSDRRLELAGLYGQLNDQPAQIAQLDLWIAAHPQDSRVPGALNARCWARALGGTELDRALKDCNAALARQPHMPPFLDSRGLVYLRMGNYARAVRDYDEALAAVPDIAWSHYGRGIAKLKLGQKEAGEADLAKARALAPKLPEEAARRGIAS